MLKNKLLNFKIRQALKHDRLKRKNTPYQISKHIGIINTTGDHIYEPIIKLEEKIKADRKEVTVMAFHPDKKEKFSDLKYDYFTKEDITMAGAVNSFPLKDFMEYPFDYLICTDLQLSPIMQLILAKSTASCRMGTYSEGKDRFFELMIGGVDNMHTFTDRIYHYLSQIRSNGSV